MIRVIALRLASSLVLSAVFICASRDIAGKFEHLRHHDLTVPRWIVLAAVVVLSPAIAGFLAHRPTDDRAGGISSLIGLGLAPTLGLAADLFVEDMPISWVGREWPDLLAALVIGTAAILAGGLLRERAERE